MEVIFSVNKLEETIALGQELAKLSYPGLVIAINGDLGAGKTTFAQGVAKGLGIEDKVSSPTFNILKCYFKGRLPFYHIDAYRLEDGTNAQIGLEEVIEGDGVCLIEWSNFISQLLFNPLEVQIKIETENTREFCFKANCIEQETLLLKLKEKMIK